ncbi:MAG: NADH-quinone oxidoreductase subunit C [Desulfovibrionaceae bacterium]|nr:NADH-quinone oxidoreductase subunit C [Desulfovibrionaceae bacterium]MBF0514941.1 NADH-quinone oxidoreductase subunit C [Desulfovibrionaceae bacterium]
MNDVITRITMDELPGLAQKMFGEGQRLATLTAVDLGDGTLDLLYHFDKDLVLSHYRLTVPKDAVAPSISGVYFAALLVENEIKDQFGLNFSGLALDFGGHLYLADEVQNAPFCKLSLTKKA